MTHIGHHRNANEDHFLIAEIAKSMQVLKTSLPLDHHTRLFGETQGILLLVADGMGGQVGGERASQLVIDGIVEYVLNRLTWLINDDVVNETTFEEDLKRALVGCQQKIMKDVMESPQRRGMGSTLTLAYVIWPRAFVLHVGDSRCYLLRSGQLKQLTRDHNLASLVRESENVARLDHADLMIEDEDDTVTEEPNSHVLWNVIAAEGGDTDPDAFCLDLEEGDVLLLCTDGLYQCMNRKRLKNILESHGSTAEMCQALVDEALKFGGNDNITAVISYAKTNAEKDQIKAVEVSLSNDNQVSSCQD